MIVLCSMPAKIANDSVHSKNSSMIKTALIMPLSTSTQTSKLHLPYVLKARILANIKMSVTAGTAITKNHWLARSKMTISWSSKKLACRLR